METVLLHKSAFLYVTSIFRLSSFVFANALLTGITKTFVPFYSSFPEIIVIFAHNHYFSNVPYEMIGFAYNSQHEFCAVITQPYIIAKREATEDEIAEYMNAIGFETDYQDEFHNKEYEIFDAVPNNVLYGIDNDLYFIDTQIRLRRI